MKILTRMVKTELLNRDSYVNKSALNYLLETINDPLEEVKASISKLNTGSLLERTASLLKFFRMVTIIWMISYINHL